MEGLRYFAEMAAGLDNPEIAAWKAAGKRVIGTVCSCIPEEVLHAAGLLPLRVRAPGLQDTSVADAQLHIINCSYTRSVLEVLMRGDLEFLDGLISTNTCDHLLRLAGELQDKAQFPVHYFSMVHALGSAAGSWLVLEIEKLIRFVEESFLVRISEADLRSAVSVYNRTRRLMAQLEELRKRDPPALTGAEALQIVITGMSVPREPFNQRLEELLGGLEGRLAGEAGRPRLMVLGGACDVPEFIDFIEARGAAVVADGLCFGRRHFEGEVDEEAEAILPAIAARYVGRAVCPSIMNGFDHSYQKLKQVIGGWGVRGVICTRLKFCDHWGGQRKLLAEALRRDGVPLLDLEREYSTLGSGQIGTRVQAFLEML